MSAPYTPKPDSLAASVVHFFSVNPDEELTLDDISDKFDAGRNNIHTQLARAVDAGLLERGRNDDGEYTYTAGKGISVPKPGAKLTTTLAKPAALRGQARVDLTGLTLVVDKDVPLPEGHSAVSSKWDKLFELLTEVGYSIEIPIDVCLSLRAEAQKRAKRGAGHYRVLKTGDSTARIWRVPAPEGNPTHQPASKPARKSNGAAHV